MNFQRKKTSRVHVIGTAGADESANDNKILLQEADKDL